MATPPKPSPPPEAAAAPAPAPAPRKRGKLMLIISLVVVVLAGGGGGAWYWLGKDATEAPVKAKATVFLALEVFTVNLISKESLPQYLQTAITFKLPDDYATVVRARMPEVRNRVLIVLSSKSVKELLSPDGKSKLALEIAEAVQTMIAPPIAAPAQTAPAASVVGEAQAAAVGEVPPAAAGDAQAAPEGDAQAAQAAEGAEPAASKLLPQAKAQPTSNIEVLFTSFIIQ